ncbi:tyrosine-type recombinase/integrase [Lentzea sp. NPDC102401]|uniref:tyrosine-type recombinase/integrase n=1 Tax=Lentzea sp. NPDC102401 TaxID=3364128 RepID=UPI00382A0954
MEFTSGLSTLMLCRVLRPGYRFLAVLHPPGVFEQMLCAVDGEVAAALHTRARELAMGAEHERDGRIAIAKMMIHTGRDPHELTAADVLKFRAATQPVRGRTPRGAHTAWDLLRAVADLGEHDTLRDAVRVGQQSAAELVDRYGLRCRPVRDVLVRYLTELRTRQDFGSILTVTSRLVRAFWRDIELHHPEVDSLQLTDEVAEAWKQRLRMVRRADGSTRPRKAYFEILRQVRAFYLDIHQWARDDPYWAQFAVPSPVRRGDTDGTLKVKKATTARMHQRVRDRLPQLPVLIDTAERLRDERAALLTDALNTPTGELFVHRGQHWRHMPAPRARAGAKADPRSAAPVVIENADTGERVDAARGEDDAFWTWAIVEVLRHTGVRVEELLEITHLAVVSYQVPGTGEVVPLLQIVPSKNNEERLLVVSPELARVLATVISRLRRHNGGSVPLTGRYDIHERLVGTPLPHLFQRRVGWRWQVPSYQNVGDLLDRLVAATGILDAAGRPLRCTPHDFRRMFATDAVSHGLPVHIVARLLGHSNINTTQAYTAVFDDELVRSYRVFLDRRRAQRPTAEYRQPTDTEWTEFQQHFHTRKLELGDCARPYGTPCRHEHACIRCPSLRIDPRARPRLVEIIANLRDRITEAQLHGWLGEVQGLQVSLTEAARKLVDLDTRQRRQPSGPVELAAPIIIDRSERT